MDHLQSLRAMVRASPMQLNRRFIHLFVLTLIITVSGWLYLSTYPAHVLHQIPLFGSDTAGKSPPPPPSPPHLPVPGDDVESHTSLRPPAPHTPDAGPRHTIDELRAHAQTDYTALQAQEKHTLRDAAAAYEARRGRRPPPGFDKWYEFARSKKALVVEEFFDRVHADLDPFWAIPALQIRQEAAGFLHRIRVRHGVVTTQTDLPEGRPWMNLWGDLVGTVAEHLPDLDMAINVMDESRLIVPWETIAEYMKVEKESRRIVERKDVIRHFSNTSVSANEVVPAFDPEFGYGNYWDLAVVGCPPTSAARTTYKPQSDYTQPPPLPNTYPVHSHDGYVKNWTLTKSPCENPDLQQLHGTFVEPISMANSNRLMPMFGGSKLPMNNEILLPPAMYWTEDPMYSGGKSHGSAWEDKTNKVIWRGVASGGRNKAENWTRFQRHRFLAMLNSTSVSLAETSPSPPPNFVIPKAGLYNLTAPELGKWVGEFSDVGFVELLCFPDPRPPFCEYTDPWYTVAKPMPMKEQYEYKYLPDIDGNSFSGRYRGFLGSTSLPIKATIYDEWHDTRLVPWIHFAPMDNTFADFYGIMEYFIGNKGVHKAGHDHVAKEIAMEGKAWAEKVLRLEDMQVYVLRLLLEYARICDDNRERLGWIDDE